MLRKLIIDGLFIVLLFSGTMSAIRFFLARAVVCFPDCSGANFMNRNFEGRNLQGGSFVEAYLAQTNLSDANLEGVDFSGANVQHGNLRRANLRYAFLLGTDLTGADLGGAQLEDAELQGANLTNSNLSGVDFSQANLLGAIFEGAELIGADLSGANLVGSNFRGADLSGADLGGADLSGATLSGANLSGANMRNATLKGAFINLATLTGADLANVDLGGASLIGSDVTSVNFNNASLLGALIMGATFDGADMRSANFRYVRDIDAVTPFDMMIDPLLSELNVLQLRGITRPSSFEGVEVNHQTVGLIRHTALAQSHDETESEEQPVMRVGILHSLSGPLAFSESAVLDATLLAIDQINAEGGILGHRIQPIVEDGASNPDIFAEKALKLTGTDGVNIIFGAWSSASRRAILPIIEEDDDLLFYSAQHEGLEQSANVFYLGPEPAQQVLPAVDYLIGQGFASYYLVGTDYTYTDVTAKLVRAQLSNAGAELIGETRIPLGDTDLSAAINQIRLLKPAIVLNTLIGVSNQALFEMLATERGLSIPTVMSFSMAEPEIQSIGPENMVGQLTAWGYFQTINTPENFAFVDAYKEAYGEAAVTSDPEAAGYTAVYVWKALVEQAGSFEVTVIQEAAADHLLDIHSPIGLLQLEPETHHVSRPLRIGRIRADGQIDQIADVGQNIAPDPQLSNYPWAKDVIIGLLEASE